MCTNRIFDEETGLNFSCRKCDQCRSQAVNDVKLRLLAEHRIGSLRGWPGYFVTLTYGSDNKYYGAHRVNPRALNFYYEDFQQWRKRLWKAGYPHRAYVVGQSGDQFGRIHWHVVIWFTGGIEGFDDNGVWFCEPLIPPNIYLSVPHGTKVPDVARRLANGEIVAADVGSVQRHVDAHPDDLESVRYLERLKADQIVDRHRDRDGNVRYLHWLQVPDDVDVFSPVQRDWRDTSGGVPLWTHGWSHWEQLTDEGIAYATAYIFRDGRVGDTGIGGRGYAGRKFRGGSQFPPLGSDYFVEVLAPQYVEQMLPIPKRLIIHFKEVMKPVPKAVAKAAIRAGKPVPKSSEPFDFFLPPGATRRMFLDAYVNLWREKYGNDNWPQSDLVDEHVEDMARRQRRADGVPDVPEDQFDDDFYKRRNDKNGGWQKLNQLSGEDRERFRFIRSLQEAGFDVDVPEHLRKLLGPGNNKARNARNDSE